MTHMVNFSIWIPDCDSHSPALWIYFLLLILVFVIQQLFLHWEILIMSLSPFPLTFHRTQNVMPCFITYLMTILAMIRTVVVIISQTFNTKMSLNSILLLLLVNFVSVFRLELMYISITKVLGQASSPWFSVACAAAILHRNKFFHLY